MAFAPQVTAPDVTTPGQVTTSAPFTPTANGLQIVGGGVTGPLASQNSIAVSSTHAGQGAWTVIQWTTTAASQCSAFIAVSKTGPSPGSGTVSVTLGAAPVGESWFPSEIPDGFDPNNYAVGAVSAGAGNTATTPVLTLTAAPAAGDIVLATFASRNDPNLVTPGPGFTAVGQANGSANPRVSVLREWDTGTTSPTVTAASMGTVYNAGAALIVKAAPGGGPNTTLTAALSGSGALAAVLAPAVALTAAFTGAGTLSAPAVVPGKTIAAPFTGSGALAAVATPASARTVGFTGSGQLAASTSSTGQFVAAFTGTGQLRADLRPTLAAPFTGDGQPTVRAVPGMTFPVALDGGGDITVTVAPASALSAAFTGAGSLAAALPHPAARDLQLLSTTVPVLAWAAGGPVSGWTAAPPATDDLPTTTPASAWATSLPEH